MFRILNVYRQQTVVVIASANFSRIRQNFSKEVEDCINKQINAELYSSYVYQAMRFFFDRSDVALPGFSDYFKKSSDEEREHAQKLMSYLNKRGGRIVLESIAKPEKDEWTSPVDALELAFKVEKSVNQAFLDMHKVASMQNDPHFASFIESEFLNEQVNAINEISRKITELKRVGPRLGEDFVDQSLLLAKTSEADNVHSS